MLISIIGSDVNIVPSIHRLPGAYLLPKHIASAANVADIVFFERNLDQTLCCPSALSGRVVDVLSGADLVRLRGLWVGQAIQRDLAEMNGLSVVDVAMIVDVSIDENTFLLKSDAGIDAQLWRATGPSKRQWIEQDVDLASTLSVYPEAEQLEELRYVCDVARRKKAFLAELKAWEIGDTDSLGMLIDGIYLRTPQRAEAVLRNRNEKMLRSIVSALKSGNRAVFVLGAAHVVGEHGVLQALRLMGYQVSITASQEESPPDARWRGRLTSLLKDGRARPAICMQGGGARGAWAAGVLSGLLSSEANTTPSSIWGTSAGALNALWSTASEIEKSPNLLLNYWITLARRLVVSVASLVLVCALLLYHWASSQSFANLVLTLLTLTIVIAIGLLAARLELIRRLPGLIPSALVRLAMPKPQAISPRWSTYMCVCDADAERRADMWAQSKRGWFVMNEGDSSRSAQEMSTGDVVDALDVAIASSSLPILVRTSQLDGMSVLDGGLIANLPSGFVESNGTLGGAYVLCVVPRAIAELNSADAIDRRTLNSLIELRDAQKRHRELAMRDGTLGGPAHTDAAVFVLTPNRRLDSGLYCFWPTLLRKEFDQGTSDAKAFSGSLARFAAGNQPSLDQYLLETQLGPRILPQNEGKLGIWRLWVNSSWH